MIWERRQPCLRFAGVSALPHGRATAPRYRRQRKSSFQPSPFTKRNPERIRKSLNTRADSGQFSLRLAIFELQRAHILQQIINLISRNLRTEVFRCDVLDLMRFVQNYGCIIRQHGAISAIPQSQVGKEQMMIHDDDVGIDRPLAHASDKARFEVWALLAQASIRTRIDVSPERKILRQAIELCAIAGLCFSDPTKDFVEVIDLVEAFQHGHAFGSLDAMQAGVVVPSFHDGGAKLRGQHVLKKRNVFVHQLLLQILGAG